jgi:hypothetical protein
MVVRLAADVTELRRNLAEGKASIEALGPSVEKLGSNWKKHSDALVQDARNITAAVDKFGASTLTAADSAQAIKKLDAAMEQLRISTGKVPPEMQQTADKLRAMHAEIDHATSKTSLMGSALAKIGPMMAATFSVGAIVAFGRALLSDADEMVKLSDKTAIGIEQLQRLKYAAEQSGNTLDQVTMGVSQMQNRLAGGDESAVQALKDLGIEFSSFVALSPDAQFRGIAEAVAKIEDPMLRAQVATDLFGKSGREILPTLIADIQKLGAEAPVTSEAATRGMDDLGDALDAVWAKTKSVTSEFLGGLVTAIKAVTTAANELGRADPGAFIDSLFLLKTELPKVAGEAKKLQINSTALAFSERDVATAIKEMDVQIDKQRDAAKAAAEVTKRWNDDVAQASEHFHRFHNELIGLIPVVGSDLTAAFAEAREAMKNLDSTAIDFELTLGDVIKKAREAAESGAHVTEEMKESEPAWQEHAKAISGAAKAFSFLADSAEQSGHKTTAAIASIAAATLQAFAASGGNWWAAAGTAAAGTLSALSGKFFKDQGRSVNDMRDAYIGAAGGLAALNAKAYEAGLTLTNLLKAGNVQQYQAAILELEKAMGSYNAELAATKALEDELKTLQQQLDDYPDWKQMQEAAEKYGVDLASLGPQFQSGKLHAAAAEIWNDFELLTRGGADVGGVLLGMSDEISKLVQDSVKFGTDIPEQFRPLIQSLIDAGKLVDENGNALTNMAGLKFGAPVVSEVDKMIAAIEKLIAALADKLIPELDEIGRRRPAPWEDWGDPPSWGGNSTGNVGGGRTFTSSTFSGFGSGSAGLGRVVAAQEARIGGAVTIVVPTTLDGREIARSVVRYVPHELTRGGL